MRRLSTSLAPLVVGALLACGSSSSSPECSVPPDCPGTDTACRVRTCTSGTCGFQNLDGVACDVDGNACTADTCVAGTCQVGLPLNCDDGVECTFDACDATSGGCIHTPAPAGTACGSGLFCDGGGSCVQCFTASDCPGTATACQRPACVAGSCAFEFLDGASCNSGSCTVSDFCSQGVCQSSGTLLNCDDGLSCTADACNASALACESTVLPGSCLIGGQCFANGAANPANPCLYCNAALSQTSWQPFPAGYACDADGSGCTPFDSCDGTGVCVVSTPASCDDGLACTVDTCTSTGPTTYSCSSSVAPGSCVISGACYASGAPNPANSCQACDPTVSATTWVNLPAGTACGTGLQMCDGLGACI